MRIIIETQNEGRILLEPDAMQETEAQEEMSAETAIDGGPPGEALLNAIAGSSSSQQSETSENEDGAGLMSSEALSSFH